MKIRVLLAEDHRMFRDALRVLLDKESDIEVVAEVGDGLELLESVRMLAPDIVCMDIGMPNLNGIEATRRLLDLHPRIKVIGLSAYTEKHFVLDMLNAGALGYIAKASAGDQLLSAIRAVQVNRKYLCPMVAATVAEALVNAAGNGDSSPAARLSSRERQVLQLIAEGNTSPQIGERLHVSPATIDVHRRNIMRKLSLHSIADLTRFALRNGIAAN
jgi:two-component system NarL family response regulator